MKYAYALLVTAFICSTLHAETPTSAPPPVVAGTPLAVGDLPLVFREGVDPSKLDALLADTKRRSNEMRAQGFKEALAMDHVQACGFMQELPEIDGIKGIRVPTAPFTLAHDGPALTALPPRHSEHTDEILGNAGYDAASIARFRAGGVI